VASPRTRDVSVCDCSRRAGFGVSYAAAGRRAGALKDLDQLNELSKKKFVSAKALARIYAALGEKDKAFKWLEKSYDERSIGTGFASIKEDPTFDPLSSDPRFQDLLRRMNLRP
jgi:tetratricopeptide (TPR) repeat protein